MNTKQTFNRVNEKGFEKMFLRKVLSLQNQEPLDSIGIACIQYFYGS